MISPASTPARCGVPAARVPVPTAPAAGVACRRPHAGLSADQADQPGDASTDPRIHLQRRSAIMGSSNRPDDRTHPADVDETELRQVQPARFGTRRMSTSRPAPCGVETTDGARASPRTRIRRIPLERRAKASDGKANGRRRHELVAVRTAFSGAGGPANSIVDWHDPGALAAAASLALASQSPLASDGDQLHHGRRDRPHVDLGTAPAGSTEAHLTALSRCSAQMIPTVGGIALGVTVLSINAVWLAIFGQSPYAVRPILMFQFGLLLLAAAATLPRPRTALVSRQYVGSRDTQRPRCPAARARGRTAGRAATRRVDRPRQPARVDGTTLRGA